MDRRPHRLNEKGEKQFDIIFGTRFASSVSVETFSSFFAHFAEALSHVFAEDEMPKIKIDHELIGDPVLKDRRSEALRVKKDRHFLQIEIMKDFLVGEKLSLLIAVFNRAINAYEQERSLAKIKNSDLRESFLAWLKLTEEKKHTFSTKASDLPKGSLALTSLQRSLLNVSIGDKVKSLEGKSYEVMPEKLVNVHHHTSENIVSISGSTSGSITLEKHL